GRGAPVAQPNLGHGLGDGLEQLQLLLLACALPSAALFGPAVEVELLLDLVSAGVLDLIAEIAELGQVSSQGSVGDPGTLGQLEGVEAGFGHDGGQDAKQAGEPVGAIHRTNYKAWWSSRPDSIRPAPRRALPGASQRGVGEEGVPRGNRWGPHAKHGSPPRALFNRCLPRSWSCPQTGRARPLPGCRPSGGTGWRSSGRPW